MKIVRFKNGSYGIRRGFGIFRQYAHLHSVKPCWKFSRERPVNQYYSSKDKNFASKQLTFLKNYRPPELDVGVVE